MSETLFDISTAIDEVRAREFASKAINHVREMYLEDASRAVGEDLKHVRQAYRWIAGELERAAIMVRTGVDPGDGATGTAERIPDRGVWGERI